MVCKRIGSLSGSLGGGSGSNGGGIKTVDFTATVVSNVMTATSADWKSSDIKEGNVYILDIFYNANIDTVSSDTIILNFSDGVTSNIYSSINATGVCRLLDLEQVQYPYNAQTGHRYIFEALAGKNANSELIFTMIPATSQQDIISITSKELLDIVGGVVPFEYNNEQLFYVTDAGTNGYKQGHTYKAIYNFTTNEVTTEDTTAVSAFDPTAFETYATSADLNTAHPRATTKYLYNIKLGNFVNQFRDYRNLIGINCLDTSAVTNMNAMFLDCYNLVSVPAFDTSSVTNTDGMFYNCSRLVSVPAFNTSSVTITYGMFFECSSLVSVPAFNTANMTNMGSMFRGCVSLTSIHMTGMKTSFDISASTLFTRDALNEIIGNLATVTTATTLTMGAANLAKLTAEDIAVGTNKGWTIA